MAELGPIEEGRRRASERALRLYDESFVCDMTMPWSVNYAEPDLTLPRFHRAGVGLISLTLSGPQTTMAEAIRHIAKVRADIRDRSDRLRLCSTAADMIAARAEGKLAVIFNQQETEQLDGRLELVQLYSDLGVRHMVLAYNQKNRVGDGCAERTDAGLSRFGVELVAEMNRVGVLVDGSHCGYRTSMEAMEVTTKPFLFSHCNAHAVYPHFRNIRDDQIKACAATGGLIGVNGLGAFLDDVEASTASMFRHLDHMANLVGPRHLGIGLDYLRDTDKFWASVFARPQMWSGSGGQFQVATRFAQPEQLLELTDMMVSHGYSDEDVRGILGGNFLRLCREVWG